MTIDVGTRLGPYEVLALIGRGGMGEVFRARDTRLNRDVALKVLLTVADSPARRARFVREGQAISQLSHPNICALYDVGEFEGIPYLVMEFVEGESLADRLRRGPVPWTAAVPWAIQIASAIDAAHRRGIVHRDLKPANVMIGDSGIKLLDFGLAKLVEGPEADRAAADLHSTTSLTTEQKLLGTIHYMSPEQLEGRAVDHRADIFAFGATLYEMLTGRRAFEGASAASVTAAILTSEPPSVSTSRSDGPVVPPALDHVLRRSLAKDPGDRWQSAHDLAIELRWIQEGHVLRPPSPKRVQRGAAAFVVCAAVAAAAGATLAWLMKPAPTAQAAEVFQIYAPEGTRLDPAYGLLAVSPDGRRIAFLTRMLDSDDPALYVRDLDRPDSRPIPGTGRVINPFWSPDGASIAYFDDRLHLVRVEIADGTRRVLCDAPAAGYAGGTPTGVWLDDGTILVPDQSALYRVKATGGPLERIWTGRAGKFPSALPDGSGRFLAQLQSGTFDDGGIVVRSADGRQQAVLPSIVSNAAYVDGHLVFREGESLVAQTFDARRLRLTGRPVVLASAVQFNTGNERTVFAVAGETLAYREPRPNRLVWKDASGAAIGFVGQAGRAFNPVIAPDGSGRVAFDFLEPPGQRFSIATVDAHGQSFKAITHGLRERFAVWSPDGQWIVHLRGFPDTVLARVRADGKGEEDILLEGRWTVPVAWSPDGKYLLYMKGYPPGLWALPVPAPGQTAAPAFLVADLKDTVLSISSAASWSPDGRWIAYATGDEDHGDVWIQSFPRGDVRRRVAPAGANPVWRADSKMLFYEKLDGTMMAAPTTLTPTVTIGQPVALFRNQAGNLHLYPHPFAVTPDGQRFLVNETVDEPDRITVVLHWMTLVR